MSTGASTPEELELLVEDGFMLADRGAVAELFEPTRCCVRTLGRVRHCGGEEIPRAATTLCERGYGYLADPAAAAAVGRHGADGPPAGDQRDPARTGPPLALCDLALKTETALGRSEQ